MFGAKSSPTCANYALKRVGLDSEEEYPIATKALQNNFYMDDFIKSVKTPEEAIEVFNQQQPLLSQHGIERKKWINPRRIEINQQHKASRSGTQYRGTLSARTAMDRYR